MRSFIALAFLLSAFQALAGETLTTVVSVVDSLKSGKLLMLSAVDGRVYKTDPTPGMKDYLMGLKDRPVRIVWTERGEERLVTQIDALDPELVKAEGLDLNPFAPSADRDVPPTDVGSFQNAQKIFNSLNDGDKSRSQCFKRAHIWSWDMWSNFGVQSQKMYIFYTRRYIQLEEFDWWFHVAPVVIADGVEYVFDRTYTKKPVTVKEWKEIFMKGSVTCSYIDKMATYDNNQWSRLCYLMKTPMWYFRPLDMRNRDEKGIEKNNWVLMELQDSRRAFKDGADVYEALDTGRRTVTH